MVNPRTKSIFSNIYCTENLVKSQECCQRFATGVVSRFYSQQKKANKLDDAAKQENNGSDVKLLEDVEKKKNCDTDSWLSKYSSSIDSDVFGDGKWKLELAWLTKALEPALQLCKRALPTGSEFGNRDPPPSTRSVTEIIASLQKSKLGIQDWTLGDLTVGLYLLYLRQASSDCVEHVRGVQIASDSIIHDLIYHTELAKGAYKDSATSLAKQSMLRESNVLKFVKNSSVMRPGYYIGVDPRKKLVIFGIRGTHTVYDLITDIASSGEKEVTFEGYSTHFGTAEAARWFLDHEIETIRECLAKNKGYRLRLVGHSLGAATASLLAIMLRKKSVKELGFCPDIVSAVGYATPPCVSKELAECCSDYVTTVLMQDDIIPRLSVATLTRLRNEILETDWTSVAEKEDWKSVIEFVTNAKQVVSSVQDVARKVAEYAMFTHKEISSEEKESLVLMPKTRNQNLVAPDNNVSKGNGYKVPEELFVPGSVYYLKRNLESESQSSPGSSKEFFTLWKRHPGEHFRRIVLSANLISDHKCDNHYFALRDVLKGLPGSNDESIFG